MSRAAVSAISDEMRACIDNCLNCHATCEATLSYWLARDGGSGDRSHILLLMDCAEICRTSAGFLLRGSDRHQDTCETCAKICSQCADWCDRLPHDAVMQECGATCRECATSCAAMAKLH